MSSILRKIIAFFMSVLAFFGIGKGPANEPTPDEYKVEGKTVTFCFEANPTTGYGWEVRLDGDAVQKTRDEYVPDDNGQSGVAVAGRGGKQYYAFTAVKPGKATLTFTYLRPWEGEAIRTAVAEVTVDKDLNVTVTHFEE